MLNHTTFHPGVANAACEVMALLRLLRMDHLPGEAPYLLTCWEGFTLENILMHYAFVLLSS